MSTERRRRRDVTLSRPEKLNALSGEMLHELTHAFRELLADPTAGRDRHRSGAQGFSAGVDIGEIASMSTLAKARADPGTRSPR